MNILETIQNHAQLFPERIAIRSEKEQLTYQELWEASDRLADWLLEKNPSPGEPIAVYGHKHPWMIVCFLGCVKAGCAYCPIDTSVPQERVKAILTSLRSALVLAVEPLQSDVPGKQIIDVLQMFRTKSAPVPKSRNEHWVSGDSTYYIIFTSGSTGTPKGVQISADCLNHYLDWSVSLAGYTTVFRANIDGNDFCSSENVPVFLNQAPFSFDLSVMDLYTCLAVGGTLYCLSKAVQADYAKLTHALQESQASVWVSTPSFADMCLSEPRFQENLLPELHTFLFCGETLSNRTVKKLLQRFPAAKIFNTYGPTESTVAVTGILVTSELNETEDPLPVGRAKPGTILEIWDEDGQPLPEGGKGEIIILGDTVSTGYYRAPELTRKSFFQKNRFQTSAADKRTALTAGLSADLDIPSNLPSDGSASLRGYHTGDKGYLKNGLLYYCGRIDLQIKLHGYRIELEDIENNLRKLPDVAHAVVLPNYRNQKVTSLTAYVTGHEIPEDLKTETQNLKNQLAAHLPDYMIPKKFVFLDQMPMTSNGKADRRILEGMQ